MSQDIPDGLAAAAANPATDPEQLRMIAYEYPPLRAVVAANPSAYPGLLDWLAQLGDPYVDQALFKRSQRQAPAPTAVYPNQPQPGAYPAATQVMPVNPQPQPVNVQPQPATYAGAGQYPANASSGNHGAEKRKSRRPMVIIAILVALILVLSVIAFFLVNFTDRGNPVAQPTPTVAPSQPEATEASDGSTEESTPTPSPSPSAESPSPSPSPSESEEIRYPAPNGAINTDSIQSPTGNIRCVLQDGTAMCSLAQHDFSAGGFADCGDGASMTVGGGEYDGALRCDQSLISGGMVLEYGQTAVSGDMACSSFENGISCWNVLNGKGFAINRAGWRAGTEGVIPPEEYGF